MSKFAVVKIKIPGSQSWGIKNINTNAVVRSGLMEVAAKKLVEKMNVACNPD